MKFDYYILNDDKTITGTNDLKIWSAWFKNTEKRIVQKTAVGEMQVSTVFLGLDHRFAGIGEPLLFETMIFGHTFHPELEGFQERYCSYDEALKGHERAVKLGKLSEDL